MTTVNDVYVFVSETLLKDSTNIVEDEYIDSFLESLSIGDSNCKRLLICIGIDLKNYVKHFLGKLEFSNFVSLVRKVIFQTKNIARLPKSFPPGKITNSILFSLSLSEFSFEEKKPEFNTLSHVPYIRVITFKSFILHIVHKNKAVNPLIPATAHLYKLASLYDKFVSRKLFSSINISNLSSSTGWVFVADEEDVKEYTGNLDVFNLVDSLGFYIDKLKPDDNYVYICYPPKIAEVFFQPTSLTGDWGHLADLDICYGNEFFMSNPILEQPDGIATSLWGGTFSVSGTKPSVKERVHIGFNYDKAKHYRFSVNNLGKLDRIITKASNDLIINTAIIRFESA